MEEFEFDLQCIQPTTNFNNNTSGFTLSNESGTLNCNYQSPIYNSCQINNPIFNIFFNGSSNFEENFDETNTNKNSFENDYLSNKYNNLRFCNNIKSNFLNKNINNIDNYKFVCHSPIETNNYCLKEKIINMLKKKCMEFLPNDYDIEIII